MTLQEIDWTKLGKALRAAAIDAHGPEHMPNVEGAYDFLLCNPGCFNEAGEWEEEWPAEMPQRPNIELIGAYYRPDAPIVQTPPTQAEDEYVWIKIGIRRTKGSDGWDLKCGDDTARDVSGLAAEAFGHRTWSEHLDALQTIVDQAEPNVGDDQDIPEDDSEESRYSGTPEHRSIG